MIVHGLADENVHFRHTLALTDALSLANKPYRLQVYANERHGIRNPALNEHYLTLLSVFIDEYL